MFWHVIISAYGAVWFLASLLFTRHFFQLHTQRCEGRSTECKYDFYDGPYHGPNCHAKDAGEWKHDPLTPGEAMATAIVWPLVLLYGVMLWNHLRTPFSLRQKHKQRVLTDAELKRLDDILYNQKEAHEF